MSLFEARAKPTVKMTYRAVGSSTGQLEFIGADQGYEPYNDFGSGDIPIGASDYEALTDAGITVMHVPFSLGAMSFFHNVPNVPSAGLKLNACVLAQIFNRDITTWDDAAILELNPTLSVPAGQPILVYHRVFGSSTTAGITTYLNAACPNEWPEDQVGSTVDWAEGTFEAQGSGGMSAAISGEEYTIGYIDSGHGHDDGLSEISLANSYGTFQTSTEAVERGGVQKAAEEALLEGVLPDDPTADFSAVSLHNMPGQDTWPIVAISYLYMRGDQTTKEETGPLLKAFGEYVLSDEGQDLLGAYNFEAVPADVKNVSLAALDLLELPADATEWSFESADATQAGAGQMDYVISGKRRAFFEYAVGELEDEKADLSALVALERRVDTLTLANSMTLANSFITLHGSGTTNPSKFFWEIMSLFEARAKPTVKMTYRAVGSSTGQLEFIGADQGYEPYNDFGSGDIPIGASDYEALTDAGITVMHVPFSLGAMSFFHNVPNVPSAGLKLNACVLAQIFNRDITTWDDAAILELNPTLSVPAGQPILVYHRVFGSSTTAGITTYLNAACPNEWPEDQVGSTVDWAEGTFEAQGSGGMSAAISGEEYTIGYIDSGHGHDDGLSEISLANSYGTFQTSTEAVERGGVQKAAEEALLEGVLPDDPTADFSAVSLHNMPGQYTWPIVAISYIYLRGDQSSTNYAGALLKAFVEYAISDEGQGLLGAYNFEAVPNAVRDVALQAVSLLELAPGAPEWSFESADATQGGAGQLDFVISGKRRAHDEYAIGELEDEKADLSALVALEADLARARADLEVLARAVADCDCDDDDADDAEDLATGALVVGIVGIIVGILGVCLALIANRRVNRLFDDKGPAAQKEVCLPEIKPSAKAYGELKKQGENKDNESL